MACPTCRTWNTDNQQCVQVRCLACGVEQCHSRGFRRGTCAACFYGMLPGWSGNNNVDQAGRYPYSGITTSVRCDFKGCDAMAVYTCLPGAKAKACKSHGDAVLARRDARAANRRAKRLGTLP